MNLLRKATIFFFLSFSLAACDSGRSDASNKSSDTQQVTAESAAQQITDAMNQSNVTIESDNQVSTSMDGKLFKADLLSAIDRADKIVITEHSNENDYYDPDDEKPYQGPFAQYGKVELSAKQKADFTTIISGLPDNTQDAFAACIFDPHHSILFYSGGKLISTMEICFMCGQIQWKGSTRTPPWSIYPGLNQVVKSVGLSPERDWSKLAKAHRNK